MLSRIYTYYCLLSGLIIYLLIYPIQFIFLQSKVSYFIADRLNYLGIKIAIFFWFFDVEIHGKEYIDRNKNYVFVSNHASYLDIPMFFLINKGYAKFVGKSSLQAIPLFGYMYKKLYIMVNRRDTDSRVQVFEQSKKALQENRNIIIFPEGTFPKKGLPKMLPFKDGAFKIAIETKTPIVAVSILNNWKILNEEKPLTIKKHTFAAIIHKPIDTSTYTLETIKDLKDLVYTMIDKDLQDSIKT